MSTGMDLVIFEENKPLVLQGLSEGEFDYMEAASEVVESDFFRYIGARQILTELSESYPTPRKKEDAPLWLYIAANLSMRLHGVHAFHAFPMVVRSGGMINAFKPKMGHKVAHPDTGDVTLTCQGFNKKNHYDRETPCDQDYLRKMAKDTDADNLMSWFNTAVVKSLRKRRAFDKKGIFIGDASYLFVPDNPKYEGSVVLLFDEHNHPVGKKEYKKMTESQKTRCQYRRCYKMVTLLHTNAAEESYMFVALKVISGKAHECPVLYGMVENFVNVVGKGVMKRLILDRGFLDGQAIASCKKDLGIDVLIPVRRNMDIYEDAMSLFARTKVKWFRYEPPVKEAGKPSRPQPNAVRKRERKRQKTLQKNDEKKTLPPPEETIIKTEAAVIGDFQSWSSCTVPLSVVSVRDHYADGHQKTWILLDTKKVRDPRHSRLEYTLRTSIEERYRHLKCFNDLTNFTSRSFSMVVNQVVFILLAFNLLQLYLLRRGRKELNKKTLPSIRQQLLPSDNFVIVYWQNYYGLFSPLELVGFTIKLDEQSRNKIAAKCRRLHRELIEELKYPRPP